jgi:rhamnosyl/mannosyltransferase
MTRPRVLHLGKYYPPQKGGIETVVETLCRGEKRWAVTQALVIHRERSTVFDVLDEVPVRRVGSAVTVGAVSIAPTLPMWLARADADILVLHEPNPMALLAYYLARPAIPLVVWYHSEVIRPRWMYRLLYQPLLDFALRRAARVVVSSPPMLDVEALAPYRGNCVVVPYGLPLERHLPAPEVAARAAALRREAVRPTLLFVGRLVGYKGVEVLLKAMPGLDADAVIIGDGPCRPSLESAARELGLGTRVRFLGGVEGDELLAWYHACDVLVLPSITRQEAFGMVQLEAMLCARPVVSTDVGTGVSWVNQHERTGLVVRPGDPRALHDALARLISDAGLRRRLGDAARARVLEHFTAETMCNATRSLYRDIGKAASSPARIEPAVAG